MTLSRELVMTGNPAARAEPLWRRAFARLARPVTAFVVMSMAFGLATMVVNPPLRAADEAAHFLRAYGSARGEFIPDVRDEQGRRGIMLPARVHDGFEFFESRRHRVWEEGFSYWDVVAEYRQRAPSPRDGGGPVFALYQGSESYTSAAYLPYAAAAFVGQILGFDFLSMQYLMRLAGLIATTAMVAYAIWLMPQLQWAFVLIAMLPSAIYARAAISVDGIVLGASMVIAALCLRSAQRLGERPVWEHAAWMTLSLLAKPPQAAFALLHAMRWPARELPRRWTALAAIALPGLLLALYYIFAVSADVGTWRVVDGTVRPPEYFGISVKLAYMAEHPLHFFTSTISTLDRAVDFWIQLVGMLGWSDVRLLAWVYPVLTVMLPFTFLTTMTADRATRRRIAAVSLATAVGYFFAVFLIFYLTWTPINEPKVWGIQGRYFIVLLPLIAIAVAALLPRGLPGRVIAIVAGAGAMLSGLATLEAVLRIHWW